MGNYGEKFEKNKYMVNNSKTVQYGKKLKICERIEKVNKS